jgi:hypothetical protein
MNIRAAKAGLMIQEVPSHELRRIFGASNLRACRDGWRILKVIIRERAAYRRPARRRLHVGVAAPAPVASLAPAPAPAAVLPTVMADTVSATAERA